MVTGERLRITGQVQGVGFRPTVWRVARAMGLVGDVRNTGEGVEIRLWGDRAAFIDQLEAELPALARIETLETQDLPGPAPEGFAIAVSTPSDDHDGAVTPDIATCPACREEVRDPFARRYRYPFANCIDCGPRLSILRAGPYDRAQTSMADFAMCADCALEYDDPADRRFHAQPIACHSCGPRAWLEKLGGGVVHAESFSMLDDVDAAGGALLNGFILAVRGVGGVHLACDATCPETVERLRRTKRRLGKAFALMARDLDVVRRYAKVSDAEAELLESAEAPIVLVKAAGEALPEAIAPGLDTLGFMLPYTPMHHLMMRRIDRPVVMTSGNVSGRPQCTGNDEVRAELSGIADFALLHDREIINRVDDSVVRVVGGRPQILRRARGYAPQPISLPVGFSPDKQVLAMGGELKNTFCLIKSGRAILSQHLGDLEDAATYDEAARMLSFYRDFYGHQPDIIAVDQHPDYLSTKRGYDLAGHRPVVEVQHHHAHIAACLAEHGRPLDAPPVVGVALDGLGLGDDGTVWGGEFLIADYRTYQRAGLLKPVALLGGEAAVRQPWRNLYAHLMAEMGWAELAMNFSDLPVFEKLDAVPRTSLDAMIASGSNTPLSSSCGRLFDAASALAGLAWDTQNHEGEAAMLFEAALDPSALDESEDLAYPFTIPLLNGNGLPYIEPLAVWRAMLGDLILGTPVGTLSARFHRGFAKAVCALTARIARSYETEVIALTGGCFQNAMLFRLVEDGLSQHGLEVLSHSQVPANDGGLALGQAVIGLASINNNER